MNILLTNDDGIEAQGLAHLWHALKREGTLFVVAPEKEQSGMGVAISVGKPLYIRGNVWNTSNSSSTWAVSGTPADCVKVAINLLKLPVDLIVSGINHGSNAGANLLYSGTVGGVVDGALKGVPGIAFSYEGQVPQRCDTIEESIRKIVRFVTTYPLPEGTLLNVNFPCPIRTKIKGIRLARQGKGYWSEQFYQETDEKGKPHFRLGAEWLKRSEHPESDIALVQQGYIALVPVHVGELTNHAHIEENRAMFSEYFGV